MNRSVFLFLVAITVFSFFILFRTTPNGPELPITNNLAKSLEEVIEKSNNQIILPNSIFRVTRRTQSYDVTVSPKCYYEGCNERNNKRAYAQCSKLEATEWNALGVRTMERVVGGPLTEPATYRRELLLNHAIQYFNKSIAVDKECLQPHINLGLALFALNQFDQALKEWDFVLQYQLTNARVLIFKAFLETYRGNRQHADTLFQQARNADPDIDRQYVGLQFSAANNIDLVLTTQHNTFSFLYFPNNIDCISQYTHSAHTDLKKRTKRSAICFSTKNSQK